MGIICPIMSENIIKIETINIEQTDMPYQIIKIITVKDPNEIYLNGRNITDNYRIRSDYYLITYLDAGPNEIELIWEIFQASLLILYQEGL